MTGDLAKGCIGIVNQELCDVCKMLIRDELTRELDRYNGTKLKRMYKRIKAQDERIAGWLDFGARCKS